MKQTHSTSSGITMFSWGYWGWGSATRELVNAVDAIERGRGFRPPLFVDTRISRSVRAKGFRDHAFQDLVGNNRYVWMRSLGNKRILNRTGGIQIAEPKAADELLDLAIDAAKQNRRLIFFCACEVPRFAGKVSCHRAVIADLLIAAAKKRNEHLAVVEWPGGEPRDLQFELDRKSFHSVKNGGMNITLSRGIEPADVEGPPWGTVASLSCGSESLHRLVGPLIWRRGEWQLQVLEWEEGETLAGLRKRVSRSLRDFGLKPLRST